METHHSKLSNSPTLIKSSLREKISFWTILAFYVLCFMLLFLTGHNAILWKTAILPLFFLSALFAGKLGLFVKDWAVFLSLVILFDFFRGLIYALITYFHLPVHDLYVIHLEQFLCRGKILPVLLQQASFFNNAMLNQIAIFFHGSHFLFFLLVGLTLWFFRRESFQQYKLAILLTLYLGLLGYLFLPTVPPWMAANLGLIPPLQRIAAIMYNLSIPTFKTAFDVNPIAAMPSLHAAVPTICTLVMLRNFGWKAIWLIPYTLGIFFAVIYLGEHYLVDVLAGVILAGLVYFLVFIKPVTFAGMAWLEKSPLLLSLIIMVIAQGLGLLTLSLLSAV